MTAETPPDSTPELFRNLHASLCKIISSPSPAAAKNLKTLLERFRRSLISVFIQPLPNPQHREQIESGKVLINGHLHKVNAEFIFETIFLSHQLQLDEYVAAELLQVGAAQSSRFDRAASETSVLIYHGERRFQIACLLLIFRSSFDESLRESGIAGVFEYFAKEICSGTTSTGSDFISHIFTLLNTQENTIQAVQEGTFAPTITASSNVMKRVGAARLGGDVIFERIISLISERKDLAELVYLMAYRGDLNRKHVLDLLKWLEIADSSEPILLPIMAATMATLDASPKPWETDITTEGQRLQALRSDKTALEQIKIQIQDRKWLYPPVQNVIKMQWCLFLAYAFQRDRTIEGMIGVSEDSLEVIMDSCIKNDLFQFLGLIVNIVRKQDGIGEIPLSKSTLPIIYEPNEGSSTTDVILLQIEDLVIGVPFHAHSLLKKIKHREEDVIVSGRRSLAITTNAPQRDDIAALFTLIANLYLDRPDAGSRFWDETYDTRLYGFLQWARDCRKPSMIRSLFEMLGSLATGPESAQRAYEYMSAKGHHQQSLCSWSALFGAIEFYADKLGGKSGETGIVANIPPEISPEEVVLLKSFLRLLRQVIKYSQIARTTLQDNRELSAIFVLFSLFICPIPVDLKGVLLDTLAAFCTTEGEKGVSSAIETARIIWEKIENAQIIPTGRKLEGPRQNSFGVSISETATLQWNLENREAPVGIYPLTSAFIRLLTALNLEGAADHLGAEYRPSGMVPYVRYVIDNIFLRLQMLPFSKENDRWDLTDICLKLFEQCLAIYPLHELMEPINNGRPSAENVTKALLHPGFEVVSRILNGSKFCDDIINIVSISVDIFNKNEMKSTPFPRSILHSLRILYKVLNLQTSFLEQLYTYLIDFGLPTNAQIDAPPNVSSIDELLLYRSNAVIQIALYTNAFEFDEICLLAVKIIHALSQSPFFEATQNASTGRVNRLLALIDSSEESQRIMHGFVERLEISDVAENEVLLDDTTIGNNDGALATPMSIRNVREAILDLLLDNVALRQTATIGHFLLGFRFTENGVEVLDKDSGAINAGISCLHVLLDIVRPQMRGGYPVIVEKCFQIIYRLCLEEMTSSTTLRYLRIKEDFFYVQMKHLSIKLDESSDSKDQLGLLMQHDGQESTISYSTLFAILHQRSWLLKGVALELHSLNMLGQQVRSEKLLDLLYGMVEPQMNEETVDEDEDDPMALTDIQTPEPPRMIEILNHLDFVWQDALRRQRASDIEPSTFLDLDFSTFQVENSRGCVVYDIEAIARELKKQTIAAEQNGSLDKAELLQRARDQKRTVLEYFIAESHEREMMHAKYQCLQGWKQVLDVTLSEDFNLLQPDIRESLLYDILSDVLPKISLENGFLGISETYSEITVTLMTHLRQDKLYQNILQDVEDVTLPIEKLQALFEEAIEAILSPDASLRVRGNLYAMLLNYLQYTTPETSLSTWKGRKSVTVAVPMMDDTESVSAVSTLMSRTGMHHYAIETANLRVLKHHASRLLQTVSKDATEGDDVWKTVAFTLLDALMFLTRREKFNFVLEYLYQNNYLRRFVQSFLDETPNMQNLMSENPLSLNALYIHEAKTSFLVRVASRRDAAEKLIDAGIFETLAACEYVDMRPDLEDTRMQFDSFVPTSQERYRQILLPVLQVLIGVLASSSRENMAPAKKAFKFVESHRETLAHILRDSNAIITLSSVNELRLVVALLYYVSYHVDLLKVQSGSTYGSFHNLLMSLVARYFSTKWKEKLIPGNEIEQEKASKRYRGLSYDSSEFQHEARQAVHSLCMYLLAYSQKVTEFTASDEVLRTFRPLFVWTIAPAKDYGYGDSRISTSTPSIATLAIALRDRVDGLLENLRHHKELLFKSQNATSLSMQEIMEIIELTGISDVSDFNDTQKVTLANRELIRALTTETEEVNSNLYAVEVLLLLLWRHLNYYLCDYSPDTYLGDMIGRSTTTMSTPPSSLGVSAKKSLWAPTSTELETLRADSRTVLQPLLFKLSSLEIPREVAGVNYRSRNTYLQMLTRRLKELM